MFKALAGTNTLVLYLEVNTIFLIENNQNFYKTPTPDSISTFLCYLLFLIVGSSICSSQGASIASSDSPDNNNYLRVAGGFGQRRLSDNVLNAPGHRRLSGTLGSTGAGSPGSAPDTPLAGEFGVRRHSSVAFAQSRRYSSNALLSPSAGSQVSKKGVLQTNRYG